MRETFFLGEEDLGTLATKIIDIGVAGNRNRATVLLLEGDLGAGKTTFTKALAHELGVDRDSVHSPTFILKKEYRATHETWKRMVHVDAYRFTHPDEARVLRLEEDLKDPSALVVVEWPSKMTYLKADIEITFEVQDEKTREVSIEYETV
jgi:tRNA threonylcarbamoyladenosine biosynthesis protein TsaE